jgi:hypothetical protein
LFCERQTVQDQSFDFGIVKVDPNMPFGGGAVEPGRGASQQAHMVKSILFCEKQPAHAQSVDFGIINMDVAITGALDPGLKASHNVHLLRESSFLLLHVAHCHCDTTGVSSTTIESLMRSAATRDVCCATPN